MTVNGDAALDAPASVTTQTMPLLADPSYPSDILPAGTRTTIRVSVHETIPLALLS